MVRGVVVAFAAAACACTTPAAPADIAALRDYVASGARDAAAIIESFAATHPNPIVSDAGIALLARGGAAPPRVTGDFTRWQPAVMTALGSSRWFLFETRVPETARLEYLVALEGDRFAPDARNPRRVDSVGGPASEIRMPRFRASPEADTAPAPLRGRLEDVAVKGFDVTRRVVLYTPVAAPEAVVYFHDGQLMLESGRVPQILDALIASGRIAPLAAVFVEPQSRVDDYQGGPEFRRWFADSVVRAAEQRLRFSPPAARRAVIGVSRGAIPAIDAAWHRPDLFGACGLLIPSTNPTALASMIRDGAARPVRFAIVAGEYDDRWLPEAHALRDALHTRGYQTSYREVPEGHNVATWRGHLADVLTALALGPRE